jgi:hypothetical protein
MIILNKYTNVNEYCENILKFRYCLHLLGVCCKKCNSVLMYHGCYEVNHICLDGAVTIPIIRGVCKNCKGNPTHSIKPCFLPGKHQYNMHCREKAIIEYENNNCGLHKAINSAFPGMNISIMNLKYWLLTSRHKAKAIVEQVLSVIQQVTQNKDIVSEYIRVLKTGNYLHNLLNLCNLYMQQFGWKAIEKSGVFLVINAVSNEECTGCYL